MRKPKVIYGSEGADNIEGTDADENIYTYGGDDTVSGGGGSDYIQGGAGIDHLYGGTGDDRMVDGGNGDDFVFGGDGNDIVAGGEDNDYVDGDAGNDRVIGHTGDDHLFGGDGADVLIGEWGMDTLTGGAGADVFQYGFAADSTTRTDWYPPDLDPTITYGVDVITDFQTGIDKIDLSRLDADLTTAVVRPKGKSGVPTGDEAFSVVDVPNGGEPGPGQLTLTYDASGGTTIQGYMDAQAGADFTLYVATYVAPTDFIL